MGEARQRGARRAPLWRVLDSSKSLVGKWKECVEDSRKKVHFLSGHERARALKAQNRALRVMSAWKGYTIRKAIGRSTREMADKMLRKKRMEAFLKKWRLEAVWKDTVERRRLVSICRRRSRRREMGARFAHWRAHRRAEHRQRLAIARLVYARTRTPHSPRGEITRHINERSFDAWRR